MGSNSKCYLPNDIDPSDIVGAIAHLCGEKFEKIELSRGSGYYAGVNYKRVSVSPNERNTENKVVSVSPTHLMTFFNVWIGKTSCDNSRHNAALFLNNNEMPGYHCLYAGVSEFWKLIDRELIKVFGGFVDDDDCDSVDVDFKRRKPRKNNDPATGKEWQDFQQALLDIPALFEFVE